MTGSEIVVIGGGIAGASTAWHLAERGHQVVLLERGEIASEASGVNAGSITSLGWGHDPDLQSYLTAGSAEIFKQLALDLGHDFEFRVSGALSAIHTEEQYAWARDRAHRLRATGYAVELITAREARAIEPQIDPALPGLLHYPVSAQANPAKATRAFAEAAARSGARILTEHEVTTVAPAGDGYRVVTSRGEFQAGTLVLATGAWSRALGRELDVPIPIVPVRGQMWATAAVPPCIFTKIASVESGCDWARDSGADRDNPPDLTIKDGKRLTRHLYGRQTRDGEIIFGGDRQVVGYDKTVDPSGIEVNRAHAAQVLPFLRWLATARTWAGLMPFSLDGKPIIGRLPGHATAWIVSGLASSGFGRGPMAGKLLAEFIHTGHRPHVLADADPARFATSVSASGGARESARTS
jgi:sarcosine oxidase subunit beta